MSHNIGILVSISAVKIGPSGPTPSTDPGVWEHTLVPQPAAMGGSPRFVILHLTALDIPAGSKVEVPLGYATDTYTAASGTDVWTRPIDTASPVKVRFVGPGPTGSVTLAEYGSGEPYTTTHPETWLISTTNPDLFLHTNPYQEPAYQTWLRCGGTYDWQNAACAAAGSIQEQTARAVGMYVHADHDADSGKILLSSCTGTLIDTNLFLTARHCAQDVDELDIRSGSVTFDFQTLCNGARPGSYAPVFHKVRRVAAAGAGPTTWSAQVTDWLILELETVPAGITPRPLRGTAPMAGETAFTVHHPNAAVKKFQTGTLSQNNVTSVTGFDYAGGSSGSALFDGAGQVIGAALSTGFDGPDACQVGYTPARLVLDQLANPPAPPAPFDVMLVIDRSGSMTDPGTSGLGTKLDEAREAASLFVQLVRLNAGDRLGMVSFSTTASSPVDEKADKVTNGQKHQLVGNSPYTGGKVGALVAGGSTSIGDGLAKAMTQLPGGTGNTRAIVVLTDGMENTAPMIADVETSLGDTAVHVIGFGSEAQIDGNRMNSLAHAHNGLYTRASDGLLLKKFFAICFGNIFESGVLADPTLVLPAGVDEAVAATFAVCDEDRITAVVAWDSPSQPLEAALIAPDGQVVDGATATVHSDAGRTWTFLRAPLPLGGQRAGSWRVRVGRSKAVPVPSGPEGSDVADAHRFGQRTDIRYVVSLLADGGPRLVPVLPTRRVYTGDRAVPKVVLQYPDGKAPEGEVTLEVERLDGSLGELVQRAGLRPPELGEEPRTGFAATLRRLEQESGGNFPIATLTTTSPMYDDGVHEDGAMERDGIWASPQPDLFRYEGNYAFRAVATYGEGCPAMREATWSLHVELGIDAANTKVTVEATGQDAGGMAVGVLHVRPHDRYGSPLGPGRPGVLVVSGAPGTTVTGPVGDNGDGVYDVPVAWDPDATPAPGLVVSQPDRDPVVVTPSGDVGDGGNGGTGSGGLPLGCLPVLTLVLAVAVVVLAVALAFAVS